MRDKRTDVLVVGAGLSGALVAKALGEAGQVLRGLITGEGDADAKLFSFRRRF